VEFDQGIQQFVRVNCWNRTAHWYNWYCILQSVRLRNRSHQNIAPITAILDTMLWRGVIGSSHTVPYGRDPKKRPK
jgi:hypothetical protein